MLERSQQRGNAQPPHRNAVQPQSLGSRSTRTAASADDTHTQPPHRNAVQPQSLGSRSAPQEPRRRPTTHTPSLRTATRCNPKAWGRAAHPRNRGVGRRHTHPASAPQRGATPKPGVAQRTPGTAASMMRRTKFRHGVARRAWHPEAFLKSTPFGLVQRHLAKPVCSVVVVSPPTSVGGVDSLLLPAFLAS